MARERLGNLATSTLTADITNSATSLTVADASGFPKFPNFRIVFGASAGGEIALVTGVSGATFTVKRGREGTTASAQTSGTQVSIIPTAGGIDQHRADESGRGSHAAPIGLSLSRVGAVIGLGAGGAFDSSFAESPAVWFDEKHQRFGMVYTGYDGTQERIGLAWSDDLVTWTKDGSSPILSGTGSPGDPDRGSVTGPYIWYEAGTYYLFYIGFASAGVEVGASSICLATSTDLATWTRHGAVISPSSGWRSSQIYHPSIVRVGSTYYLFFNAKGSMEQIGYATSTNLTSWTVDDANSPVVAVGSSGQWDDTIAGDPSVWFDNGLWFMAYFGYRASIDKAQDGLAYTTPELFPLGWTKYAANPVLTPGPSYDAKYAHKPFIFRTPGAHFHFYTSVDGTNLRQIGLAVQSIYTPVATGAVSAATLTTKGDIFVRDSTGVVRLAVGTDGQSLTANSAAAGGVAWSSASVDIWSVLTNGDPASPEVVFAGGDVIMIEGTV